MPTPLVLNATYACKAWTQFAEQIGINTFHYRVITVGGGADTATIEELAAQFSTVVNADMKALMTTNASFIGVTVQRVSAAGDAPVFNSSDAGAGTVAGDSLPRQATGLITWRTATAGAKGRGRTYTPFPSEAQNDAGSTPSAVYQANLATLATDLRDFQTVTSATMIANEIQLGIWSQVPVGTFRPVTDYQIRGKWATQRRRGSYGRPNVSPF